MGNLTEMYNRGTYPTSAIKKGMKLIISNSEYSAVTDGTVVKVAKVHPACDIKGCDPYTDTALCHRRAIDVKLEQFLLGWSHELSTCHCTLHTIDNRLIVQDEIYFRQR